VATELVTVPDIGGAENVDVIEVCVKVGDTLAVEDPMVTLEGDKATMDIPSPTAGQVTAVKIKVGEKVSMGSPIIEIETAVTAGDEPVVQAESSVPVAAPAAAAEKEETITIPDLGGADSVKVIDVLVGVGDTVAAEDSLITLEGDKASMDVPSPLAGTVTELLVKVGDDAGVGTAIVKLKTSDGATAPAAEKPATQQPAKAAPAKAVAPTADKASDVLYASPAVRRLARELDINLSGVQGTGNKGRITKEDLRSFVKSGMGGAGGSGLAVMAMPAVDFSKFGPVETKALTKIQKLTGKNLHRNWVSIPHVTQFTDADITEMEAFRKAEKDALAKQGVRLTPLVFLMKAAVAALKEFPRFNSSLAASGEELIMKNYYHIGVAVDTPNGLVVPVIRDVDKKGLVELAQELAAISQKARETGLSMAQMQGGCFTISSLGGIGGTAFTPIINAPEVAIMGVSRTQQKPIWMDGQWVARSMLPLSLSYDHRVIDGADGARFITYFAACLQDLRKLLM
jgi:pyruvate dehydrogenase E2 component (dihydrolipoamide acetyltransferase)